MRRPLSVLLLADDQKGHPDTVHDHIRMFPRYSRNDVRIFNPRGLSRSRFVELDAFDVVVVHYSIVVIWDDYLAPWFRERLAAFRGLKVQFLQDEYRYVDAITATMRRLGIDLLYSVVPTNAIEAVYGGRLPETTVLPALTGYVPERLVGLATPRPESRPLDVGYRGRSLPYWLGRLAFEKVEIGRGFLARANDLGLRVDVDWTEGARIYGERWNEFVRSCRAMLASESGSSVVDWDGSVERAVRLYLAEHPSAPYEEVEAAVLGRFPPTPAVNTLSPRLFEAAALRTALVMFPGEYSGAVRPWEHYLPLEKDFSNLPEVAERLRDHRVLSDLTTRAYDELIGSGTFSERRFVAAFDDQLAERARPREARARYRPALAKLEEVTAGRGYHLSTLYGWAREAILAYIGVKNALRFPSLRRLLVHARRDGPAAGATSFWDDLFRLSILTSVQRGLPVLAGDAFHVVARYDEHDERLTLTSTPGTGSGRSAEQVLDAMAAATRSRRLREIVWSHATLEQYVPLRFGPIGLRVAFDVGRYDAYGVYRFDALTDFARERPEELVAALAPLMTAPGSGERPSPAIDKRGPRP